MHTRDEQKQGTINMAGSMIQYVTALANRFAQAT